MKRSKDLFLKYRKENQEGKYLLSENENRLEVFLNVNLNSPLEYVIIFSRPICIESLKFLSVISTKRSDGYFNVQFKLTDPIFEEQFHALFDDLLQMVSEIFEKEKAETAFEERFQRWKHLFDSEQSMKMSLEYCQSLCGELLLLCELLDCEAEKQNRVINGWKGPLSAPKDFEYDAVWYEVKTVGDNAKAISISSFDQLDSKINGYLRVYKFGSRYKVVGKYCIDGLLNVIKLKIKNVSDYLLFLELIAKTNIIFGDPLMAKEFQLDAVETYYVNSDFPKIIRVDLDPSILDGSYSILLNGLQKFLVKEGVCYGIERV